VLESAAREVGGFDLNLGPSPGTYIRGEDFDFGWKLVQAGKRIAYVPGCSIQHVIGVQKLTPQGLRARFQGDGSTERAIRQLRGERLVPAKAVHKFTAMIRLGLRSLRFRLQGDEGRAFEAELQAREVFGFLFAAPHGLKARETLHPANAPDD
jgi:GT2 family glycosyltransferase